MGDISTPKLILGALSLTAALAWNEAASSGIRAIVPSQEGTFTGQLIYAIIVTLVVILVAMGVQKVSKIASETISDNDSSSDSNRSNGNSSDSSNNGSNRKNRPAPQHKMLHH